MALRLRYNDKSYVLPGGQLLVGRSVECNLVINDPLASRRHAVITLSKSGAFVADLGSKAGVLVNGAPIMGAARLAAGDIIDVSSAKIVVEDVSGPDEPSERTPHGASPSTSAASQAAFRLMPTPPMGISRVEPLRRGSAPAQGAETSPGDLKGDEPEEPTRTRKSVNVATLLAGARDDEEEGSEDLARTREAPSARSVEPARSPVPRQEGLRALAGVAEKSLSLNRAEEAERIAHRALFTALEAARREELDPQSAEIAATLGAKLALALGAGRWFDYVIQLYSSHFLLMPAPVVDLLFSAVRKAKPIDKGAFRRYLATAKSAAVGSPTQLFVIQRLEGMQRVLELQ